MGFRRYNKGKGKERKKEAGQTTDEGVGKTQRVKAGQTTEEGVASVRSPKFVACKTAPFGR